MPADFPQAIETSSASAVHEHCDATGDGVPLGGNVGTLSFVPGGVGIAHARHARHTQSMRGYDKYKARVREEALTRESIATLHRTLAKRAARKTARRAARKARGHVPSSLMAVATATAMSAAAPITVTGAHAVNFASEDVDIAPNERNLRPLMEALTEGGSCFACRTLGNRAVLVAPKMPQAVFPAGERVVPLLIASAPLAIFGGPAMQVCVSRICDGRVPTFVLCNGGGSGLTTPSTLGLTEVAYANMQRHAAKLLGVRLLDGVVPPV